MRNLLLGVALGLALGSAADVPLRLAQDTLQCADHECAEGYFNVGKFSISVPPNGISADILRSYRGRVVRIQIASPEPSSRELEVIR